MGQAGLCSNRGPILKQIFQRVLRVGVFLQWLVLLTMMSVCGGSAWYQKIPHPRRERQARTRAASCGIEKGLVK